MESADFKQLIITEAKMFSFLIIHYHVFVKTHGNLELPVFPMKFGLLEKKKQKTCREFESSWHEVKGGGRVRRRTGV